MKIQYMLIICFFVFLLLISAGTATALVAEGNETQITTDETDQSNSATFGDMIVWEDYRHADGYETTDIYAYDLSTGQEMRITNNTSLKYSPVIYGDKIAWEDNRNGNWDIYVYNLSTSTETRITLNGSDQYAPSLYEDRLVWLDGRHGGGSLDVDYWPEGNWDIFMYNLSTSTGIRITTNESWKIFPAIYGDRILWVDGRNGEPLYSHQIVDGDLYMYDLSTSEETRLVSSVSSDARPDIYGDRIVWGDDRNQNSDIYMYDLVNSTEVQITDNESEQWHPAIYEDRIIWTDYRNGNGWDNPDIYMYNLSTSEEMQITTSESKQWADDIYGDNVVWTDNRNGNNDIYMFTLGALEEKSAEEKPAGKEPTEVNSIEELEKLKAHVNSLDIEPSAKGLLNAKLRHVIQYIEAGDTDTALVKLGFYIECVSIMETKGRIESEDADYIIGEGERIFDMIERESSPNLAG
jgi:TolB protein